MPRRCTPVYVCWLLLCVSGLVGCEQQGGGGSDDAAAPDATGGQLDGAAPDAAEPEPEPDAAPEPEPDADPAGCQTDEDCDGPRRCIEGACVACLADLDCVDGYVCEAGECVEGCRDDSNCPEGTYCGPEGCVEGCQTPEHCADAQTCIDAGCVDCAEFDPCAGDLPPGCPPPPPDVCRCDSDVDCPAQRICTSGNCVEGCRENEDCAPGEYCDYVVCRRGCGDDDDCGAGRICEDAACVEGCRADDDCAEGQICEASSCGEGCRDDDGCPDGICDDGACLAFGLGCRADGDCGPGHRCEDDRCVPAEVECEADRLEPNDALDGFTPLMIGQVYDRVGICPGDRDLYGSLMPRDNIVRVRLQFADPAPILEVRLLDEQGAVVAEGMPGNAAVFIEHIIGRDGVYLVEVRGAMPDVRSPYSLEVNLEGIPMCVDTDIYPDGDGDGFGVDAGAESRCLDADEQVDGFARARGDCRPGDAWANPDSSEICGDWVDDDCDGADVACPESQPAVQVPDWNCQGAAPANVYGWARFADGDGYFVDGGCFVFFEGLPGEFYVQRRLERANQDPGCDNRNGCVCPSLNGWPSYDRRLYAFTTADVDPAACEQIGIVDHGGERQPVSNDCRKYLYQMHFYDIPYSLVAPTRAEFERRIALFPTVEVACAADLPHRNLPYQSLISAPIERNPAYAPLR